jgi:hypothetical protein
MFNVEMPGGFIAQIPCSGSTFLNSGVFRHGLYLKSECREATCEEQAEYKKLAPNSKFAVHLAKIDIITVKQL